MMTMMMQWKCINSLFQSLYTTSNIFLSCRCYRIMLIATYLSLAFIPMKAFIFLSQLFTELLLSLGSQCDAKNEFGRRIDSTKYSQALWWLQPTIQCIDFIKIIMCNVIHGGNDFFYILHLANDFWQSPVLHIPVAVVRHHLEKNQHDRASMDTLTIFEVEFFFILFVRDW